MITWTKTEIKDIAVKAGCTEAQAMNMANEFWYIQKGKELGLSSDQVRTIWALYWDRSSGPEIAQQLRVPVHKVYKALKH